MKRILGAWSVWLALTAAASAPDSRRRGVPGQHLHHRRSGGRSRGNGAGRGLRRRLGQLRAGRKRLGRVRPAVRGVGGAAGQRVPDQHLHDGMPSASPPSRSGAGGTLSWSGGTTVARDAFRAGASMRRAAPSAASSRSTPSRPGGQHAAERRPGRRWPIRRDLDELLFDGSDTGIAARRFDASGNPIGSEFVVNTYTTGAPGLGRPSPSRPTATSSSSGGIGCNRDGSGTTIFGQRYDASGNRLGSEFQVNTYTTGFQDFPVGRRIPGGWLRGRLDGPGDGSGDGIFARRFDASGNAVGSDFVVNTTPRADHGFVRQVAHDARGNFVVAWRAAASSSRLTFAQRFSASGARRGAEFRVNANIHGLRRPSVASDSVGNFVVAWDGQDGSGSGIFAQRFGGLGPAALAVDSAGNQRAGAGRDGGRAALVAQRQRRRADLQRHADRHHRPRRRHLRDHRSRRRLRHGGRRRDRAVHRLLRGLGVEPAHASGAALGRLGGREHRARHAGPAEGVAAAHRRQLHRRVHQQRVLSLHRDAAAPRHHRRLRRRPSTARRPRRRASRWRCSCWWPRKDRDTSRPRATPRRCSPTCRRPAPSAAGSRSWRAAAWSSGCGGGNYCPTAAVTREQMAVFVLRTLDPALNPPACAPPNCSPTSRRRARFCRWIEELTRRGVVTGCGGGNYCPTADVTREQMSVFLAVTFGLTLYGP